MGEHGVSCAGQVIEARNLAVPTDLLHAFYTMDSYTVVSCTSEAGVTSHHTKIERNNLQPHWNERCIFEDVALSNSLTVAIFDHKKLSSDLFLGQVSILSAAPVVLRRCWEHASDHMLLLLSLQLSGSSPGYAAAAKVCPRAQLHSFTHSLT